jgi:flagellin-like protein
MDRIELFNKLKRERRSAISPIIATLLLILIAIAAGVVVYAYVLGFVGNSTGNSGNNTSVFSIDNACISHAATCSGDAFLIVVRNVGTTTMNGAASIYFTDITASSSPTYPSADIVCTASNVAPGGTFQCYGTGGSWTNGPSASDSVTVKIVFSDGGTASSTSKAI